MAFRWNDKLTRKQADKMPTWQMAYRQNGKWKRKKADEMASCKNVMLTQWQNDEKTHWQKGKL